MPGERRVSERETPARSWPKTLGNPRQQPLVSMRRTGAYKVKGKFFFTNAEVNLRWQCRLIGSTNGQWCLSHPYPIRHTFGDGQHRYSNGACG